MANLETLRAKARDYIDQLSASPDMLEIALQLKQSLDTSLAARLLRVARTVSSDDDTISRIDTQLMLVEEREGLSRLRKWFGYDLFISNAHADSRPYAEALNDVLRLAGFRCFLDKDNAPAGVELTTTLRVALRSSTALLFVGSPLSLAAPYVAKEIAAFTLLGRPVIPIDIGGTLSGSEWLRYRAEYGIADYIRVPESKEAFAAARPSAPTVEGIQKLFKLRRRATIRRSIVATAAALILVAVGIAAYQSTIARRAALVDRANQIVFLGERIVDDEPATAIALASESAAFAEVPAAATLVRRAVHLLPERQRLAIQPGVVESGPKVLVDLKPLIALSLAVGGTVVLAQDTDGQLSAWDVASGNVTTRIGDQENRVSGFGVFGYASNRLLIRFDSGVLEERRIGMDSRLNLEKQWSGSYKGFAVFDGEDAAVAWQSGGHLVVSGSNGERVHSLPGEVRSASIGELARSAAVLLENGHVGKLSFDDGTWVAEPTVQLGTNRVELTYVEPLDGAIIVERNDEKFQETLHVIVLDFKKGAIIETRTERDRELAVDRAGGKLAWLSNSEVEQLEIWRDSPDAKLVVRSSTPSGRWAIEPMESDTGEPQQILYGPFGEYLVTLNAPIMQLVGPFPGNAKLWYANAIGDERAGDPHRGLRLASRSQGVLNVAFDRTGSRLAVFFEDGTARAWDVLPESYINSHSKAADVFQRIYHLGLSTRALLQIPESETSRILRLTRETYQVALPEEVRHEIATSLETGASLAPLEQQLRRDATATIALQSRGERSEMKRWPRKGGEKATESLARLADDIARSIERGYAPDDEALRLAILQLVARHTILLTGIESTMALSEASSSDDRTRARGCILLALSGDTSFQVALDQAVRRRGQSMVRCRRAIGQAHFSGGPAATSQLTGRFPTIQKRRAGRSSRCRNPGFPMLGITPRFRVRRQLIRRRNQRTYWCLLGSWSIKPDLTGHRSHAHRCPTMRESGFVTR
jgi:WD40 repeat protein